MAIYGKWPGIRIYRSDRTISKRVEKSLLQRRLVGIRWHAPPRHVHGIKYHKLREREEFAQSQAYFPVETDLSGWSDQGNGSVAVAGSFVGPPSRTEVPALLRLGRWNVSRAVRQDSRGD